MQLIFKILLVLCAVFMVGLAEAGNGENDTKVTKTITKGYLLPKNGIVEIFNKYGQVVVNNSEDLNLNFPDLMYLIRVSP